MKRNSKSGLWPLCFLCFISFTTNVQAECKPNLGENHTWRFSAYAKKDCIDIIGSWHEGSCVDNTWSKCYNIKTNSGVDSYMWLALHSIKIRLYKDNSCKEVLNTFATDRIVPDTEERRYSSFRVYCDI